MMDRRISSFSSARDFARRLSGMQLALQYFCTIGRRRNRPLSIKWMTLSELPIVMRRLLLFLFVPLTFFHTLVFLTGTAAAGLPFDAFFCIAAPNC